MSHHISIEELSELIRAKRVEMGLSHRKLEKLSGVDDAMILRVEQGKKMPSPATLSKLAKALEIPSADLYHLAGYDVPGELPSMPVYLRTKYNNLPKEAQEELEAKLKELEKKHSKNKGPAQGEDEKPEDNKNGGLETKGQSTH